MSADAVAVTGLGMITAAGSDTTASWHGMQLGVGTASDDPNLSGLAVTFSCRADGFDPSKVLGRRLTWRMDRFIQLAVAAAREAVSSAALNPGDWDPVRVGVVIGTGGPGEEAATTAWEKFLSGRTGTIAPSTIPRSSPNMAAGEISLDLNIHGPGMAVSTACSSGATALSMARHLLRSHACDIVLAGGSDVACGPFSAACFDRLQTLSHRTWAPQTASRPFDRDRDGFVLGEGAAVLVLERTEHARARRAPIHAYLSGAAVTSEAHHPTAPTLDGSGAARTIQQALVDAGLDPADIDHVNAHGTATRLNDLAEARALRSVFRTPPPVTACKSIIGHTIAAAGAIEAAETVLSLQHQQIPPTANLDCLDPEIDLDVVTKAPRHRTIRAAVSNSFGFGGQNTVLVFTAA